MGLTYQRSRGRGDDAYTREEILGSYAAYRDSVLINSDTKRGTVRGCSSEVIMDYLNPGPPYHTGKPYTHYKMKCDFDMVLNKGLHSGTRVDERYGTVYESTYNGGWIPSFGWITPDFSLDDMSHIGISGFFNPDYCDPTDSGPEAYNKFRPKMEGADMGTFMGESRELPGMLQTSAKGFDYAYRALGGSASSKVMPKKIAAQFLNHQFGWIPFIGDLSSFIKTSMNSAKRIAQARRDNGRWIKRRGHLSSQNDLAIVGESKTRYPVNPYLIPSSIDSTFHFGPMFDNGTQPCSLTTITKAVRSEIWFAGAFRYWIPSLADPTSVVSNIQNYLNLYGTRISPSLVWNLTPWSWLIDWFTNIGDNIDNMTSQIQDNCVSKYAYIMQKRSLSYGFSSRVRINGVFSEPMEWTYEGLVRARRCASPYGFSISLPDMTARKWAILTALGLSRTRLENSW